MLLYTVSFLFHFLNEEFRNLPEQVVACVSTENAVITVGVHVHLEVFACLYKGFSVLKCVLRMHVVVSKAMANKQ